MDNQILNKTIKISSVETKAGQIGNFHKIKDENNLTYTIFETKQDGSETVAFQGFKTIKVGDVVGISYKEEQKDYQGKPYTQRTILSVKNADGGSMSQNQSQNTAQANFKPNYGTTKASQTKQDVDWDKIRAEKTDNIKWLNALNNACLLVAHGKAESWKDLANEIYQAEPLKVELDEHGFPEIQGHIEDIFPNQ